MDRDIRIKRLRFRSWHRGTKEADLLIGGYFDSHHLAWTDEQMNQFEELIEEQDVDIMAWAMGTQPVPARFDGEIVRRMTEINYVPIAR